MAFVRTFPRPLPIDPLLARLAESSCSRADQGPDRSCVHPGCVRAVSEALGISRRTVQRLKARGLRIDDADRFAVALGTHPAELWGADEWMRAVEITDAFLDDLEEARA